MHLFLEARRPQGLLVAPFLQDPDTLHQCVAPLGPSGAAGVTGGWALRLGCCSRGRDQGHRPRPVPGVRGGPRTSGAFPQPAGPGGQCRSRSGAPWGWRCPGRPQHGRAGASCSVALSSWGHLRETGPLGPSCSLGSRHLGQLPAVYQLCCQKHQMQTLVLSPVVCVSCTQRLPSLSLSFSSVGRYRNTLTGWAFRRHLWNKYDDDSKVGCKVCVSGNVGLTSTWGSGLFLEKLSVGATVMSSVDPPLTAPDVRFKGQFGHSLTPSPVQWCLLRAG